MQTKKDLVIALRLAALDMKDCKNLTEEQASSAESIYWSIDELYWSIDELEDSIDEEEQQGD